MIRAILFTVFCLLFLQSLTAQSNGYWQPASVPDGFSGNINQYNGDTCIAWNSYENSEYNKAFRSTDRGLTWQNFDVPEIDSLDTEQETFFVVDGGYFFKVLTYNQSRKLFRSTGDAQQWILVNDSLPVTSVLPRPGGSTMIGWKQGGIYHSPDGGATWQSVYEAIWINSPQQMVFWSMDTVSLLTTNSISCFSYDGGLTWAETFTITAPSSGISYFFLVSNGSMYLIDKNNILRSTDNGVNWEVVLTMEKPLSMYELPGNRLWVILQNGDIMESVNNGDTWQETLTDVLDRPYIINIKYSDGTILGQARNTVVKSSDSGATWSPSNEGMAYASVMDASFINDTLRFYFTPRGLWRSGDAGTTWEQKLEFAFNPSPSNYLPFHLMEFWSADTFVAMAAQNVLMRTFDGGETFSEVTPAGINNIFGKLFVDTLSQRIFTRTTDGIVYSPDYGASWTLCLPGTTRDLGSMVRHPSDVLFMQTSSLFDTLWMSFDDGSTWQPNTTLNISGLQVRGLAITETGTLHTIVSIQGQYHLASSQDVGQNWSYQPMPSNIQAFFNELLINDSGQVFACSYSNPYDIWSTLDNGNSWYSLPDWFSNQYYTRIGLDSEGYLYLFGYISNNSIMQRSAVSTLQTSLLHGSILRDSDADCSTPDAQEPLANWMVEATGPNGTYYGSTGTDGNFVLGLNPGNYTVAGITPQSIWWSYCDSSQTVLIDATAAADTLAFIAVALADCPLMSVDVTAPMLRRCFYNSVYVQTCNIGTESADSAWVDIELDPYLELVYSGQPYESIGLNTWRFYVGDLPYGDYVSFIFSVYVNCDSTVLGQTHCISAHAFPDSLCTTVPDWSGANLEARVSCQDTIVHFELENTGNAPSQPLDYIIIVDDVVLMQGNETYDIAELVSFEQPANGQTWRIESQQEPGHPFSTVALAFAEGCGGFGSLGFVNQFSVNGFTPSVDVFCLENTGSYDPNDKQGFPRGYGDDNRIAQGQDLEYLIRFQNTGTDTAFTVRIADTLSTWLDPASIVPGVSSHPYSWSLSGEGVITFLFENILLPDSNTNLAGSQGFVNFRIRQREQVPLNTVILNTAAIYFDFNTPVITNETRHTIGVDILNDAHVPAKPLTAEVSVFVSPNPATDEAVFRLRRGAFQGHRVMVTDAFGRVVHRGTANGDSYRWRVQGLPRGWYAWQVLDAKGKQVEAGKIILE